MSSQSRRSVARRAAWGGLTVVIAAGLVLTAVRGVRAGAALAAGPQQVDRSTGETRNLPLEGLTARDVAGNSSARVALDGMRDGLILVFDTACGPCAVNMSNWVDLAHEARSRPVDLVALTVEPAPGAAEYWSGWAGVRVLAADTGVVRNDLRLQSTPTTLLVEDGVVRRAYVGPLGPASKAELTHWLRRRQR